MARAQWHLATGHLYAMLELCPSDPHEELKNLVRSFIIQAEETLL